MAGTAETKGEEERGRTGALPSIAPSVAPAMQQPGFGRSVLDSGLVPQEGPHEARTHRLLVATGCVLCAALALSLVLLR